MGEILCTSHNLRSDKFGNPEVAHTATCQICGADGLLDQDHDHRTDLCRGRVCHSCNLLIGRFDRPVSEIQRFIDYLTFWERQHATVGAQTYTAYMQESSPTYGRGRRAPRKRRTA